MMRFLVAVLVIGMGGWMLWQVMPETSSWDGDPMRLVLLIGWGLFVMAGMFGSGIGILRAFRDLAIWAVILVAIAGGYVFRHDLQDVASQFTAGLIPGSPHSSVDDEGRLQVTLFRAPNGHFEADVAVQGTPVRFVLDTGASTVVLSARDARRVGLDPDSLRFDVLTRTANGTGRAASVILNEVRLGRIVRRDVRALVARPGSLYVSLLGQNFLDSLSSYERRGNRITLRD